MDSGYMKQIRERILAAEDGTTFATSDFADIAESDTVRQSLNRLNLRLTMRMLMVVYLLYRPSCALLQHLKSFRNR